MAFNEPALQHAVRKLTDPAASLLERRKALDHIKDNIEMLHTAQYPGFLALIFEPVCAQLTATQPQFERDSELQVLRHAALEVLSRLPANDALKQYATRMCDVCLAIVRSDNQKNAVLGVKVFLDLHKSFRASFEAQYMAFVDFVGQGRPGAAAGTTGGVEAQPLLLLVAGGGGLEQDEAGALRSFPESFQLAFDGAAPSPPHDFTPAVRSFRVLAELPLTMLGLMQVYGQAAKPPMIALLPLFSAAASQQGPELGALPKAPLRASDGGGRGAEVNISGSGAMAVGGAPRPEFLAAYSDLRTAQRQSKRLSRDLHLHPV
ncbi:transformation/transcription domain-associated protein [Monoraphidium neglectum]|uniref:Transformation/transcription domain-associated protein n=1 Tax=Monoraphidium neglectum TaxID=145388 RepID=A0A0D2MMZ5_9CHLO|nr:transformation/transcription domain-associated protein [Monoraphidium neglectum]KIZ04105.1 transformation/transcription domain-associated protein [Monoraphidium neglectum]|eukprot:XP_013903124.1 transformation/transcription domain-associated protein [Monoraphidium neglectum]